MLLSASTVAALRWPMLRILHCMFRTKRFPCAINNTDVLLRSFVKILVIEIFSSVLGLFGLIIGLLVSGKANEFGFQA